MQDVQNETEPQMRKGIAKWEVGKRNTVNSLLKYPTRLRWAKAKSKFEFESVLGSTAMCFISDNSNNSLWLFISIVRRRSGRLFPITIAQDANHYSYKYTHNHTHTDTHTNMIGNLCNLFDSVRFINSPSTFLRKFPLWQNIDGQLSVSRNGHKNCHSDGRGV